MEHKNVFLESEKNLFCKIVMGDKSDNIPSIFPKCGIKTAIRCYEDKEYFNEKLKDETILANFNRNKKLVDFNKIPTNLRKRFIESINYQ